MPPVGVIVKRLDLCAVIKTIGSEHNQIFYPSSNLLLVVSFVFGTNGQGLNIEQSSIICSFTKYSK